MSQRKNLKQYDDLNHSDLSKQDKIHKFIINAGFEQFRVEAILGDASNREYYRIITLNNSFILMDDSADFDSLQPFINMDNLLLTNGIRAPIIIASDIEKGLLLLEDFGNDSYTKYLIKHPEDEIKLYENATDVLVKLYSLGSDMNLPIQNIQLLNKGIDSFLEWYVKSRIPSVIYREVSDELYRIFNKLYPQLSSLKKVLVLRDYMADNLFWLGDGADVRGVGVIDFQDAVLGSPVYDLVSLLEDARRDVDLRAVQAAKKRYLSMIPEIKEDTFNTSYAILSAQRNLRIIGVFHKLVIAYKKPKYGTYFPRIWGHIESNLDNPLMAELKNWFIKYDLFGKE